MVSLLLSWHPMWRFAKAGSLTSSRIWSRTSSAPRTPSLRSYSSWRAWHLWCPKKALKPWNCRRELAKLGGKCQELLELAMFGTCQDKKSKLVGSKSSWWLELRFWCICLCIIFLTNYTTQLFKSHMCHVSQCIEYLPTSITKMTQL